MIHTMSSMGPSADPRSSTVLDPMSAPTWFSPWEPVPHFCPPVADPAVNEKINVCVRYALKSGPAFLAMMKEKHRGDPGFAFLFAGEAYHFYRWSLFCAVHSIPVEQPPPQGWAPSPHMMMTQQPPLGAAPPAMQPPMQPPAMLPPATAMQPTPQLSQLPPELDAGFKQVLEGLSGSKV